uniref:Retrotransposon protein, putative, unclassified n=1 Tax=Macrostomum lignano TaxID=282301 RepID=A0A1I8FM80_9PLAT
MTKTVAAASAGTAESAARRLSRETAEAEASVGTSGAVKSAAAAAVGRARRQKAPATATEGDVEEGGDAGRRQNSGVGAPVRGGAERRIGQRRRESQQAEPAVEEAVVASDAKAAESAPGGARRWRGQVAPSRRSAGGGGRIEAPKCSGSSAVSRLLERGGGAG